MLEGLFAAIALFFAPPADEARAPEPLLLVDAFGCSLQAPGYKPPPPIFVSVEGGGTVRIDAEPGRIETLGATLRARGLCNTEGDCQRIYIRAPEDVLYTDVLSTMSALKHNGFTRISLIDETFWRG